MFSSRRRTSNWAKTPAIWGWNAENKQFLPWVFGVIYRLQRVFVRKKWLSRSNIEIALVQSRWWTRPFQLLRKWRYGKWLRLQVGVRKSLLMDKILASQLLQLDSRLTIPQLVVMFFMAKLVRPQSIFGSSKSSTCLDVETLCQETSRGWLPVEVGDWGWWGWCWMWRRRIVMKHRAMYIHWGQHTLHDMTNMKVYIYIYTYTIYMSTYVYIYIYTYVRYTLFTT